MTCNCSLLHDSAPARPVEEYVRTGRQPRSAAGLRPEVQAGGAGGRLAMKTKAAVLRGPGRDWEVLELELDPPKANEVLIRFVAAGLCHSDEHLRTGDMP